LSEISGGRTDLEKKEKLPFQVVIDAWNKAYPCERPKD